MLEGRGAVLAIVLLGSLGLLAGCLGDTALDDTAESLEAEARDANATLSSAWINLTDRNTSSMGVATWNGSQLEASGGGCPSEACERVRFDVTPSSAAGGLRDELVVSATWDPYRIPDRGASSPGSLNVTVETPDGRKVGGDSLLWSATVIVDDPEPGAYVAEIRAESGATRYVGAAQVQQNSTGNASEELLPDLVTMPVLHLERDRPYTKQGFRPGGTGPVDQAAGARGCSPYEMTERGARNCLRFTNSIGNVGQGPLELRLSFENATRAAAPVVEGEFAQAIYRADGSVRLVPGGTGEYHLAHEHYHKEGVADFTLYEYDVEAGERGEAVLEGHKTSWCLVDMGLVDPGAGFLTDAPGYPLGSPRDDWSRNPREGGTNCQAATPEDEMVTGVSAGWWDMYEWFMPDQYVEVSDLPDGTYELVSVVNPEGAVVEADPDNNAGGVVFEWSNGEATVLDRWSKALPS